MSTKPNKQLSDREADFLKSWLDIKMFYADLVIIYQHRGIEPFYRLVSFVYRKAFREPHYAYELRAGQSMHVLKMSRSRQHGLRPGQPVLAVDVYPDNRFIVRYRREDSATEVIVSQLLVNNSTQIVPPLAAMMKDLMQYPID